ncbi:MAG TPA: DUF3846 domain-containing protein [Propionibacteriaceae bacterium]
MVTALAIPADVDEPIRLHEFDTSSLTAYLDVIRGDMATFRLFRPDAAMYASQEGEVLDLPPNDRATALLWVHNSASRGFDTITGDAFIVGPLDDDMAEDLPVPDELVQLLMHTERYRIEVQTHDSNDWKPVGLIYTDWYPAYSRAMTLARQQADIREARVVAAT